MFHVNLQNLLLMEIKDKEGQVRIKFSNFSKPYDGEPVFIDLLIEIVLDNASAKEPITVEILDFEELLQNLKKLNESLKLVFYFKHIDEQFQLKFEPLQTGNIRVAGFLKDKLYLNSLNFSFEIVPTELGNIIRQIENLINALK